jgi:hypothetical protein
MIIYLDSKDFIELTDSRDKPEVRQIWDFFVAGVERGDLKFGFSFLHVVEVLNPDSRGYEDQQRAYGETIYRLCDLTFPFLSDVIQGAKPEKNGLWGPRDALAKVQLDFSEKSISKLAKEELNKVPGLTRNQRRLLSKSGNLSRVLREADVKVPKGLEFSGLTRSDFLSMVSSPARSRRIIQDKLVRLLSDPRYYSEVMASVRPDENPVRDIITESYSSAAESIQDLWRQGQEMIRAKKQLEAELKKLRDEGLKHSAIFATTMRAKKRLRMNFDDALYKNEILKHPRFEFLSSYVKRMIEVEKPPSNSEIRDLLHLFYAHDADAISVDRAMFEKVKQAPMLKGKVFRSLKDLKDSVEARVG